VEKLGRISSLENKDTSQSSMAMLWKRGAENALCPGTRRDALCTVCQQQELLHTERPSWSSHFFTPSTLRARPEGYCGEPVIPGCHSASFSERLPWNQIWLLRRYPHGPQQVFVFLSISKPVWQVLKARLPAVLRHRTLQVWKSKWIWCQ